MKDLEVEVRVRNNRLKERRLALGLTQKALAEKAGVAPGTYSHLECLSLSPFIEKDGALVWRTIAKKLASFYAVGPEELFPAAVFEVETPVVTKQIDGDELAQLFAATQRQLPSGPDEFFEREELKEVLGRAVTRLRPRVAEAIRLHYGLDGNPEHTLDEIGEKMFCGKERVRQLVSRGLRELRHPRSSTTLKVFDSGGAA